MDSPLEQLKKLLHRQLKRNLRTSKKYLLKTTRQLEACRKANEEHHAAELLQAFLYKIQKGDCSVTVEDWLQEGKKVEISLNPLIAPHLEIAARFKKAKKLEKGLPFAEREQALAEQRLKETETRINELELIEDQESLEAFAALYQRKEPPSKEEREEEKKKPYHEFLLPDGTIVWAGKNAAGNDTLTFSHAKGNDLWAHATGVSGSHVVIRTKKGTQVDPKTLKEALKIALYHSKARHQGEGEVTVTHVKNVKRFGKVKGKVQVAQEKRYLVKLEKGYSSSDLKR